MRSKLLSMHSRGKMANEHPSSCDHLDGTSKQSDRKKHQLQGGFECVFVEDPPKHLQTECSICLCVLRDPYLVDCCGYSFCRSCIEPVKVGSKLCPLCNVQFTNFMPDKRLQRVLNEMSVYCSNREAGCQWLDELSKLPQHLNIEPVGDSERLSGCPFVSIKCHLCGVSVRRQDIQEHEMAICPQRPCKCTYCNEYESTYEDITSNHWPVCPIRPVPCPNECGMQPELQHLEEHLKKECCNAIVKCSFSYAGCEVTLLRKEVQAHIVEGLAKHMSLQAESHQRQLKVFSVQLEQLNTQIQELNADKQGMLEKLQEQAKQRDNQLSIIRRELEMSNAKVKALEEKVKTQEYQIKEQEARIKKSADLEREEQTIVKDINELKHKVAANQLQVEVLHNHISVVPVQFIVDSYRSLLLLRKSWYSRPFYSHPQAYKMKLNVDVMGCDEESNTHVSVYVCLMAGEFDNDLNWPFKGRVTIELVDPEEKYNNFVSSISFTNHQKDKIFPGGEDSGVGKPQFISRHGIKIKYLRNNRLHFNISSVDL